jgi:6-phosphogluconolactonase (cycloisomerase 2 family)
VRFHRQRDRGFVSAVLITFGLLVVGAVAVATKGETDNSRLVSVQKLPDNFNDPCSWEPPSADASDAQITVASPQEGALFAALQRDPNSPRGAAPAVAQRGGGRPSSVPHAEEEDREAAEARAHGARSPVRTIRDTAPTYSAIAVDTNSNEVILQDNNLWEYQVFDRLAPTPAGPTDITPPKRTVRGDKTLIQFNNGLYVDAAGDIFSVESDTGDRMVRFPRDASGDVPPKAVLHTPHRIYNLAGSDSRQEIFATVEYPPEVVVYPKDASGEDQPLRVLEGDTTGLDAPHGIAVDEKDQLLFVNTWGHHSDVSVAGTGKWFPPAIKVYSLTASGDAAPLRVITGDKTELDWPAAMKFDPDSGELYVANDIGQSVLVFAGAAKAAGNIAPSRAIHGPSTRLRNPTGVALDLKNKELWVSNLGNSSATVYPLDANGDASPLRVIRSAEESKRGVNFGRISAVTYDPIRQEILVPN